MKISDLNKIDIKDIDLIKIKNTLMDSKELMLQVVIGIVTFFVAISIVGGSQKEIKKYKNEINTMRSKTDAIEQYKKSQADINAFLQRIPPSLTEGEIITLVTDLADKNHVKILTFTPQPNTKDQKSYKQTTIQFSLQTASYKSMVGLIADIEHTKGKILQIRTCTVENPVSQDNEEVPLTFAIEVASLEVQQ